MGVRIAQSVQRLSTKCMSLGIMYRFPVQNKKCFSSPKQPDGLWSPQPYYSLRNGGFVFYIGGPGTMKQTAYLI